MRTLFCVTTTDKIWIGKVHDGKKECIWSTIRNPKLVKRIYTSIHIAHSGNMQFNLVYECGFFLVHDEMFLLLLLLVMHFTMNTPVLVIHVVVFPCFFFWKNRSRVCVRGRENPSECPENGENPGDVMWLYFEKCLCQMCTHCLH